jgi:hypothetical protein
MSKIMTFYKHPSNKQDKFYEEMAYRQLKLSVRGLLRQLTSMYMSAQSGQLAIGEAATLKSSNEILHSRLS